MNKTAIIVISHNNKEVTERLCDNIVEFTKSPFDLLIVETGSNLTEVTDKYPVLRTPDKIRMTRGINKGIEYLLWKEKFYDVKYNNFWILVNDTILNKYDTLTPMLKYMTNENIGEIHPAIENSPSRCLRQDKNGLLRSESFCEIICPLFSRKAIELNLFDDRFLYGWGIDFEIPYILHKNNLKLYICDEVSIIHNPGTTVLNGKDEDFKNMTEQFDKSRDNMLNVLIEKYGDKWAKVFLDAIPNDVSGDSYLTWLLDIGQNATVEDLK